MSLVKRNLGSKMYLSLGLTGALLLLVGGGGIFSASMLSGLVQQTVNSEGKKLQYAMAVEKSVASGEASLRGVLLGAMTGDAELTRQSRANLQKALLEAGEAVDAIQPLLDANEGRRLNAELRRNLEEWAQQTALFLGHVDGQRFDEATRVQASVLGPLLDRTRKDSAAMAAMQRRQLDQAAAGATTHSRLATLLLIAGVLVAAGVSGAATWVMRGADRTLKRIAAEIADGARQVASAAQQVSSSSQALAQGSSQQAASLEQTSASTEELNSMTQKNAENASMAAGETEKADQLLKETNEKLGQMIGSMKEINASSEKISRIIRVIDEIAFQTNILALNAAVEAARAGEAGMGFAVVADEVRNLSQRCAQAAKDTSDLIEESIVRSNEGKLRLDEVAACISRVFDNASRIRVLASEVHMGSQEQARGIEQIARAVAQMQQVTQSTAASAEESASAGEEMSAQAQHLQAAVGRLRELVGADGDEHEAAPPARTVPGSAPAARAPGAVGVKTAARMEIPLEDGFRDF
ncbi:MAG: methyl-accepting chemotaxis protein [Acidobacteriota bacterium]